MEFSPLPSSNWFILIKLSALNLTLTKTWDIADRNKEAMLCIAPDLQPGEEDGRLHLLHRKSADKSFGVKIPRVKHVHWWSHVTDDKSSLPWTDRKGPKCPVFHPLIGPIATICVTITTTFKERMALAIIRSTTTGFSIFMVPALSSHPHPQPWKSARGLTWRALRLFIDCHHVVLRKSRSMMREWTITPGKFLFVPRNGACLSGWCVFH